MIECERPAAEVGRDPGPAPNVRIRGNTKLGARLVDHVEAGIVRRCVDLEGIERCADEPEAVHRLEDHVMRQVDSLRVDPGEAVEPARVAAHLLRDPFVRQRPVRRTRSSVAPDEPPRLRFLRDPCARRTPPSSRWVGSRHPLGSRPGTSQAHGTGCQPCAAPRSDRSPPAVRTCPEVDHGGSRAGSRSCSRGEPSAERPGRHDADQFPAYVQPGLYLLVSHWLELVMRPSLIRPSFTMIGGYAVAAFRSRQRFFG